MKKQNETKNETPTQKRVRKEHIFFLYVNGKGFIHLDKEVGAAPSFTDGELLSFPSKASANYAREFFLSMKLADSIDIVAKVG